MKPLWVVEKHKHPIHYSQSPENSHRRLTEASSVKPMCCNVPASHQHGAQNGRGKPSVIQEARGLEVAVGTDCSLRTGNCESLASQPWVKSPPSHLACMISKSSSPFAMCFKKRHVLDGVHIQGSWWRWVIARSESLKLESFFFLFCTGLGMEPGPTVC